MNTNIPLRVQIRQTLKKILPHTFFYSISYMWRKTGSRFFNVQGIVEKYTADFTAHHPRVVQAGPFAGLQYVSSAVGSNYLHKLIGSYEAVLHPVMEKVKNNHFDTILDIGSAEGYYLIGLGRTFPNANLIGFEMEEKGRLLTQEMYEKNSLSNKLTLQGQATALNIGSHIIGDTLLICDCEGAELDILNPEVCPALESVRYAIIELHDEFRPGVTETLTKRFSKSHTISLLTFKMADPEQFPYLKSITNKKEQYELLRERGIQDQQWMILEKNT